VTQVGNVPSTRVSFLYIAAGRLLLTFAGLTGNTHFIPAIIFCLSFTTLLTVFFFPIERAFKRFLHTSVMSLPLAISP
jgi:hypothetical protein